jgi:hypothetical protein
MVHIQTATTIIIRYGLWNNTMTAGYISTHWLFYMDMRCSAIMALQRCSTSYPKEILTKLGNGNSNLEKLTYRVFAPRVSDGGPHFLLHYTLLHVFKSWMLPHLLFKWKHILWDRTLIQTFNFKVTIT